MECNMELPESLRKILEMENAKCFPGRSTFKVCPVCGWYRWAASETDKPNTVIIELIGDGMENCARCVDVGRRSPEIVRWVLDVLAMRGIQR